MQSMSYKTYIQSDKWKAKRQERLKIDDFKCVACGYSNREKLQVHHLTYDNLYHENIYTDLVSLCPFCHRKVTMMMKRRTRPDDEIRKKTDAGEEVTITDNFTSIKGNEGYYG